MGYGFAEIDAALAEVHAIAVEKRSAFANRLKHLQRLGFPSGVNTGRGRAATYLPEHLFLLAVALQINEFGITPERAIRLIDDSLGQVAEGVLQAINPDSLTVDESIYCHVPASSLEDLSDLKLSEWGLSCGPANKTGESIAKIATAPAAAFRMAVFSISGLLSWLPDLLRKDDDVHRRRFLTDMRNWAAPLSENLLVDHLVPRSKAHGIDALRMMKRDGRSDLAERFAVAHDLEAEWKAMIGQEHG